MPVEYQVLLLSFATIACIPFLRSAFVPYLTVPASKSNAARPARSGYFDMARGFAIVGVIIIHLTYLAIPYVDTFIVVNDFLNNLLRFALPIFFVSSGALLMAPTFEFGWLKSFFQRRFLALGVPYVLITLVLSVYQGVSVGEFWYNLVTGNAAVPLYFVPVMFQLYLLYPLIYNLSQRHWFVWVALVCSVVSYLEPSLRGWQDLSYATPYLFFFVWGIYMRHCFQNARYSPTLAPWILIIVVFIGLQLIFGIERFYNGQYFYGIAIMMCLWWLYTKELLPVFVRRWSEFIGQRSLWIFLTHFTLLQLILHLLLARDLMFTIGGALLFAVCGILGSVALGVGLHYAHSWITDYGSNRAC